VSRPHGNRNKKRKPQSKEAKRKEHQRRMEASVKLHEFLTEEAKQALAAGNDPSFLYQGTQAKILRERGLGKKFDRVADRLKRAKLPRRVRR
jgi:hypothetical protein